VLGIKGAKVDKLKSMPNTNIQTLCFDFSGFSSMANGTKCQNPVRENEIREFDSEFAGIAF